jgi:hypothetical protein
VRIVGAFETADGGWRVEIVKHRAEQWYRLVGGDQVHDNLHLATVEWLLGEAGVSMADLSPVEVAA